MCGLFGLLDYGRRLPAAERHRLVRSLALSAEERGTDAAGVAYFDKGKLRVYKAAVAARRLGFYISEPGAFVMGHTRMTTQGDEKKNENNHPFCGKAGGSHFALAHNGHIWNDKELRARYRLPETAVETDSYIAVQLIERAGKISLDSLAAMAEDLWGSFAITILNAEGLYMVCGDMPLCIWHYPMRGLYAYASTEEILRRGLRKHRLAYEKHEVVSADMGDILRITMGGTIHRARFNATEQFICDEPNWAGENYHTEEYADIVYHMARWYGMSDEELGLLLDYGYDLDTVESLIYDPELRRRVLAEVKTGGDPYCG